MLRSERLSPGFIGLAIIGLTAAIIAPRELAFWGKIADTPSFIRTYFKGYERPTVSRPPYEFEGAWARRFDTAIGKAYWSNQNLVSKLESFRSDAFAFYDLLNGPSGKFGTIRFKP